MVLLGLVMDDVMGVKAGAGPGVKRGVCIACGEERDFAFRRMERKYCMNGIAR